MTDSSQPLRGRSPEQLRAAVMGGFHGDVKPVPVTLAYRLGALVTAFFMVLLPLIYIALIALVIAAVGWHAVNHVGIIGSVRGRGAIFTVLIYLAPLVIGGLSIFFMIKPLFAAAGDRGRARSLTPHSDPLLFEFVARICQLVNAPMPKRIDVDCDINASASYRRGWLSWLLGRDLVLTIGLPLAAGLSLQQFAGVLAHELGHFAQGTGMRLTYVIISINRWFMRVVYQRDAWDEWLEESTEDLDLRLAWILFLARGCIWLTRRILWLLMIAGQAVSGYMSRQMEFDADRYEARLAGSATFEAVVHQLHLLQFAYRGAQSDLGMFFREGRLADNLPKLVMANVGQLPKEVRELTLTLIEKSTTGVFDTHPADRERIASAKQEQTEGAFRSTLPATSLFAHFDAAAQSATLDYYHSIFGPRLPQEVVRPVAELLAQQSVEQSVFEACERFFFSSFGGLRPIRWPTFHLQAPANPQLAKNELDSNRKRMLEQARQYQADHENYSELDLRLREALQATGLYSNQLRPKHERFKTTFGSEAQARQERDRCRAEMGKLDARMEGFEAAAGGRLHGAISLLQHPAVTPKVADGGAYVQECQRLLPIVSFITNHLERIAKLRHTHATVVALVQHLQDGARSDTAIRELQHQVRQLASEVRDMQQLLAGHAYPFDHVEGAITVARYLLKFPLQSDDLAGVLDGTDSFLDNLMSLYGRSVSRLCAIAERVEKRLGFPPLEAPAAAG